MHQNPTPQFKEWIGQLLARIDPITKGWAVVLTGNISRMALSFLASTLIVRALGPTEFGTFAVLGAAMAIAGVVADFGLSVTSVKRIATVWPQKPASAFLRARVAFWYRLLAALAIFIVAGILAVPISRFLLGLSDVESAPLLFVLAMAGMVAVAISGGVSAVLQATRNFKRLMSVSVVNAGLTTLLAGALFWTGRLNLLSALIILGILTTVGSIVLSYLLLPGRWGLFKLPSRLNLADEGRSLFRFGRWLWIANLMAVLTMQIDLFLVSRLSAGIAVGIYALAFNLANRIDVVNSSLYTALLPSASSLSDRNQIRNYLRGSLLRSIVIGLCLAFLILIAGSFILVFYGPQYAPAIPIFRLLLIMVIFDAFTLPIILLAFPLNQPKILAASDAFRFIVLILVALPLIPIIGPAGAAIAKIGAKVAGFLLLLLYIWRKNPYPSQSNAQNEE